MTQPGRNSEVLHLLRCMGTAGEERLAAASGFSTDDVRVSLEGLAREGSVEHDPGPFGGWTITDTGRKVDDIWLREQVDGSDNRDRLREIYRHFLILNPELLQVCSDWQIRKVGGAVGLNDHSDSDYDAGVLSRLLRIDESAQELCDELAEMLPHFATYRPRLSTALDRALARDHTFVADRLDSYHTTWFQLHEDLLVTLGLSRGESSEI